MPKVSHLRFSFRRMRFNMMLAINRRLLRAFTTILKISVLFWTFVLIGIWFIWFPKPEHVLMNEAPTMPVDVPLHIVNEPPFSDLREPASRPVPSDPVVSGLELAP